MKLINTSWSNCFVIQLRTVLVIMMSRVAPPPDRGHEIDTAAATISALTVVALVTLWLQVTHYLFCTSASPRLMKD